VAKFEPSEPCYWLSIALITASDQKSSFDTEIVSSVGSLRAAVMNNNLQINGTSDLYIIR